GNDLVIVMALADRSLRDLLTEARQQGLAGVARPTLLSYLYDAAEALDTLNLQHGVPHLSVQPRNLLLEKGRLKVADLGLSATLADLTGTRPSGLEAPYAPPELLAGNPARATDQYSLAVVYQELLTGRSPFPEDGDPGTPDLGPL